MRKRVEKAKLGGVTGTTEEKIRLRGYVREAIAALAPIEAGPAFAGVMAFQYGGLCPQRGPNARYSSRR